MRMDNVCAAGCALVQEKEIFISVCPSSHMMHFECVEKMFRAFDKPSCPICRDNSLTLIKEMVLRKYPESESESDSNYENDIRLENEDDFIDDSDSESNARAIQGRTRFNHTGTVNIHNYY